MNIADFVFDFFEKKGINQAFCITGGGSMYLNDALGRNTKINTVFNLHQQACAISAQGYARIKNKPAIVCVTTGPGGTNTITGVMGAWVDSIPMIVISGQVKTQNIGAKINGLRQLGDQQINIVDIVKPITKYANTITDIYNVENILTEAYNLSINGRPGPVWIDIPLDIQNTEFPIQNKIKKYNQKKIDISDKIKEIINVLQKSSRPIVVVGNGIHLSNSQKFLLDFINKNHIPVLTTVSGADLIAFDNPNYFGRIGILGNRHANFILQNADVVLVLGSRMNLRTIGFNFKETCKKAYKIMIDIDENELKKNTFKVDLPICINLYDFLKKLQNINLNLEIKKWIDYCNNIKDKYPVYDINWDKKDSIINCQFICKTLLNFLKEGDVVVTGNGTAYTSTFQTMDSIKNIRMISNVGCASMGWDLPAAIGASFASKGHIYLITGDGSIQMNIQQLQTIKNYNLPITIVVYNNQGYLSIRNTQKNYFNNRYFGSSIILPNIQKIAYAYDYQYFKCLKTNQLFKILSQTQSYHNCIIQIFADPDQILYPKSVGRIQNGKLVSNQIQDMYPFINKKEYNDNMVQ